MTATVVEVGPHSICGPNSAPQEWISVALDCVDDPMAVLGERIVEVPRLWGDVLGLVAGERAETLVLVIPTWWSSARADLVADAGRRVASDVVVVPRSSALRADDHATVVELAAEFVVIAPPDSEVRVLPRDGCDVAGCLGAATSVLIDVPTGVAPFPPAVTAGLRAAGIPVRHSDRRRMSRAAIATLPPGGGTRSRRGAMAVIGGAVLSVGAVCGGWAAFAYPGGTAAGDPSTALLVEGSVAIRVPAQWVVERITVGPGSARLRVSAPAGESTAIHLTQSTGATPTSIAEVAESLRRALRSEHPGVFVDFDPDGSAGGRPAVTYRELRADSETAWAVVIDGATRIAIGCQSPPTRRDTVDDACVRAVQSAHVVR
ncbi:type VII secretion-associated protein [Mycolicibacterium sp. CR10]|uniref:type VII secretion-associated protein n=1 Tax=Mycolicibacterium sp. CR10 TaxID=2562314 RepID=UPI0010BF909B|nr:type VII secretion-associated protein [Mycolicibacterium sp. CR10]